MARIGEPRRITEEPHDNPEEIIIMPETTPVPAPIPVPVPA